MMLRASWACHFTSIPEGLDVAERPLICGGVLSIRKGSLTRLAVRASPGGLLGASDAVMRTSYSPSGNAVLSQLYVLSRRSSFRSFHALSPLPRISIL